jgi:hypothetical protein
MNPKYAYQPSERFINFYRSEEAAEQEGLDLEGSAEIILMI